MLWNRETVKRAITNNLAKLNKSYTVSETKRMGEYDMIGLTFHIDGLPTEETIRVTPIINTGEEETEGYDDNHEIDVAEVITMSCDSSGGCHSSNLDVWQMYGIICGTLKSLGVHPVNNMNDLF